MAIFCSPSCEKQGSMCQICYHYGPSYDGEIWRMDIEYATQDMCTKHERPTEGWLGLDCKDFRCPASGGVDWKDKGPAEFWKGM